MPEDFRIKSFLVAHMEEIRGMLDTEYNEAEVNEAFKEEGREERDTQKIEEMLSRGKTVEEIVDFWDIHMTRLRRLKRVSLL